jgi:hypothetical protein
MFVYVTPALEILLTKNSWGIQRYHSVHFTEELAACLTMFNVVVLIAVYTLCAFIVSICMLIITYCDIQSERPGN